MGDSSPEDPSTCRSARNEAADKAAKRAASQEAQAAAGNSQSEQNGPSILTAESGFSRIRYTVRAARFVSTTRSVSDILAIGSRRML